MRAHRRDLVHPRLPSRAWKPRVFAGISLLMLSSNLVAAEPADKAIGDYIGLACPKGDLTCVPTRASDHLRIFRAADGTVRIDLSIAFEHGQRCQLETGLTFSDGALRA